jgi:hypothetical protein
VEACTYYDSPSRREESALSWLINTGFRADTGISSRAAIPIGRLAGLPSHSIHFT